MCIQLGIGLTPSLNLWKVIAALHVRLKITLFAVDMMSKSADERPPSKILYLRFGKIAFRFIVMIFLRTSIRVSYFTEKWPSLYHIRILKNKLKLIVRGELITKRFSICLHVMSALVNRSGRNTVLPVMSTYGCGGTLYWPFFLEYLRIIPLSQWEMKYPLFSV